MRLLLLCETAGKEKPTQLLSKIFVRIAYSVESFDFRHFKSGALPSLFDRSHDHLGNQPDLPGELDYGSKNDFQKVHQDAWVM